MSDPFFSIIIPTLNEEEFLPHLLNDICKQRYKDYEVIIVDARSGDRTAQIAREFEDRLPLRFFNIRKRNVSYQRNYGAKHAQGEYFVFFDADSRISVAFLKKVKNTVKKSKFLILIPATVPQEGSYKDVAIFNVVNLLIDISQRIGNKPFTSSGSMIFQSDYFLFLGGFDEKMFIAEDHEIVQRAKKHGVSAQVLKGAKLKYSLRRLNREGRLDVFLKYVIALVHFLKKGGIYNEIFEYEMGGRQYKLSDRRKSFLVKSIETQLGKIKKIRAYFETLLKKELDI